MLGEKHPFPYALIGHTGIHVTPTCTIKDAVKFVNFGVAHNNISPFGQRVAGCDPKVMGFDFNVDANGIVAVTPYDKDGNPYFMTFPEVYTNTNVTWNVPIGTTTVFNVVNNGVSSTVSKTWAGTAAGILGGVSNPTSLPSSTFEIKTESVVLATVNFTVAENTVTAAVAKLNADAGAYIIATDAGAGRIQIVSRMIGSGSYLEVVTPNGALGFSTQDHAAGTGDAFNMAAMTPAEFASALSSYSTIKTRRTSGVSGKTYVSPVEPGQASSISVVSGGAPFGFSVGTFTGTGTPILFKVVLYEGGPNTFNL